MLSVEFLSPQNGSAWKWGPTSRQTPFLVTPGILGNLRRVTRKVGASQGDAGDLFVQRKTQLQQQEPWDTSPRPAAALVCVKESVCVKASVCKRFCV